MTMRRFLVILALTCVLTACATGPEKKVHPSTASIQQLSLQPDGRWKLTIRIQNFSTFPMHYSALHAMLSIDGRGVGEIQLAPDMDIVGNSADVVETMLAPTSPLPASGDFAYQLKGTIDTSEPQESFKFDRSSRLSPVPGIPNTYR